MIGQLEIRAAKALGCKPEDIVFGRILWPATTRPITVNGGRNSETRGPEGTGRTAELAVNDLERKVAKLNPTARRNRS